MEQGSPAALAGLAGVALALPAHLLYGATLGVLTPKGEIVQPIEDRWPLTLVDA